MRLTMTAHQDQISQTLKSRLQNQAFTQSSTDARACVSSLLAPSGNNNHSRGQQITASKPYFSKGWRSADRIRFPKRVGIRSLGSPGRDFIVLSINARS